MGRIDEVLVTDALNRAMTIDIRSHLRHETEAGDGIRAFVISSRHGLLKSAEAHKQKVDLNADGVEVREGDTIDFLVDIGKGLNNDQHLWRAAISATGNGAAEWDSREDFAGTPAMRLTAWEQLAQVLLFTNEFLFID